MENAAKRRVVLLCLAGGCPKAVELGEKIAIIDDTSEIKIDKRGNITTIILPKDWLVKIVNEFNL